MLTLDVELSTTKRTDKVTVPKVSGPKSNSQLLVKPLIIQVLQLRVAVWTYCYQVLIIVTAVEPPRHYMMSMQNLGLLTEKTGVLH